jgi:hypothetical protein
MGVISCRRHDGVGAGAVVPSDGGQLGVVVPKGARASNLDASEVVSKYVRWWFGGVELDSRRLAQFALASLPGGGRSEETMGHGSKRMSGDRVGRRKTTLVNESDCKEVNSRNHSRTNEFDARGASGNSVFVADWQAYRNETEGKCVSKHNKFRKLAGSFDSGWATQGSSINV